MGANLIITAAGCQRCRIAKGFLRERGMEYREMDIKADLENYRKFYASNRKNIYRGPDGIEFPIFSDGTEIRQGLGMVVAFLHSGTKLDGFFTQGVLHNEWVDGIRISGGDSARTDELIEVLEWFRKKHLKLQLDTYGKNPDVLKRALEKGLADRVVMNVLGPKDIYRQIRGDDIHPDDAEASMVLVTGAPEFEFRTTIAPVFRREDEIGLITPEEIGQAAKWIKEATGDRRHHYILYPFSPEDHLGGAFNQIEALPSNALFPYRTAARKHLVKADIVK